MKTDRIVITGMGAVTPIGVGVPAYWENLVAGACGVGPIAGFDAQTLPVKVDAEVKSFHPEEHMPKRLARDSARFSQFAYVAAEEALNQSGLDLAAEARRIGITMGTAMSGITSIADTQAELTASGKSKVSPRFVPKILGNIAAAQIAIEKGLRGPCFTVSTACSSGADSINLACMTLWGGQADAVVAVGAESTLCPIVASSLAMARALTRNGDPATACRPFDVGRDGFVMGEGGGALVLELESHAKARGAHILGVLLGIANNTDGYHVTSPAPDGRGAIACMEDALAMAGLSPEDIGYINAHGTSTPMGDTIEINAIKAVFGAHVPPVSSTKGATGHMMGAGGVTEVITCLLAVREGILPPTVGCVNQDPACDVDVIPGQARRVKISAAMSNAFGFGGQNSSVIVGAY